MDTQQLSATLVTKSLNFHGQQLQKLWEGERGENDLIKLGVPVPDYTEYQVRQKFLNFQDRGKRLKLQQFIAKKASALFDAELLQDVPAATQTEEKDGEKLYAVMPPFELFMNLDKSQRLRHFFEVVKLGDHILGTIINKTTSGMMLKVLSSIGPTSRYVADINVKAFCPIGNTVPAFDSKKNVTRGYAVNDSVVCEILEVIPDTDKMVVGMKGTSRGPDEPPSKPPLGLIHNDDYPAIYKKAAEVKHESYNTLLLKCPGFSNPSCTQYLADLMGLGTKHFSNMKGFRGRFPEQEYAIELRQVQASKWAFRSVAEGIEHFKAGRHTEAFQCLNKALNIDPRNVEGLVARGALYANTGSFKRAIEDFEMSLKLNPSHANARKYMGETLVALGRSFEEENKFDEARKAYQDCLAIIPFHEEALNSIEFLKNKSSSFKPLIDAGELLLPNLALSILEAGKDGTKSEDKKDKKKKKKSKSKKKRGNSSSSSSSSSSDSSNSSSSSSESSSDSSSSSADSEGNRGRKKKRTAREAVQGVKQRSLSPLSKRMALMDDTNTTYQFNKASSGFPAGHQGDYNIPKPPGPPPPDIKPDRDNDYESKVRKFLEATRDDSDYEDKVRKFLDEARSFKKGKAPEDKSKKKKNKKDKSKAKKESRRKKREKEREEKKKLKALKRTKEFDLREFEAQMESKKFRDALRLEKELSAQKHGEMFGETTSMSTKKHRNRTASTDDEFVNSNKKDLDDLDELESKLNAYYAKMEKDSTSKRSDSQLSLPHEASPKPLGRDMRDFREVRQSRDMRELRDTRDSRDAYGKFSSKDSEPENKWKMNFGKESRFNKKSESKNQLIKSYPFEATSESDEDAKKSTAEIPLPAVDKSLGVRKVMSLKEPPPKKEDPPPKPVLNLNKPNVVLDKFGSFRLVETESAIKPGKVEGRRSRSRSKPRNYRTSSSRSRSGSRKRSKSGSYARKYSRSRSRSYHSRSRSRSRSRSHSRSYGSRSRSRSHSRRRFDRRLPNRGRGGYERGTYYKPRFNTGFNHQNNNRGGGFRGRGYRDNYDNRNFRGRGHRGNYNNGNYRPWGRGGGQRGGRFFNNRGNFRDYNNRDRRYDRRSRDRSEDRRSYSDDERKEREKRFDDKTLSEGEVEHDNSYVDDKEIEGKWADKSEVGKDEQVASTM